MPVRKKKPHLSAANLTAIKELFSRERFAFYIDERIPNEVTLVVCREDNPILHLVPREQYVSPDLNDATEETIRLNRSLGLTLEEAAGIIRSTRPQTLPPRPALALPVRRLVVSHDAHQVISLHDEEVSPPRYIADLDDTNVDRPRLPSEQQAHADVLSLAFVMFHFLLHNRPVIAAAAEVAGAHGADQTALSLRVLATEMQGLTAMGLGLRH